MKNFVGGKPEETMKQRLWPVHCVQSTPGSDFIDEVDMSKVDLVIHKGMDARVEMYSAFSDSFGNLTGGQGGVSHDLESILKDKGISHVYVVGLAGDYCVKVSTYFLYKCVAVWPRVLFGTVVAGYNCSSCTSRGHLLDCGCQTLHLFIKPIPQHKLT